jgi:hypothetical protein
MATVGEQAVTSEAVYDLTGTLLEVCTWRSLPMLGRRGSDEGNCLLVNAYHLDEGTIDGIDMSTGGSWDKIETAKTT